MAELELEATHRDAYALILSLGSSLPIQPPLLLQLPLQPQLRCRGGHNFLRCAGKEDPSTMEVGRPAQNNNSNSGR